MVSHYLFEAEFCNPASGWEKGQVEKNVQDARHRLWQPMPSFPDLEALNAWLEQRCRALWSEIAARHRCPARSPMSGPRSGQHLMPLPPAVRRLRRAQQARLADLPGPLRAQPLQRAGVLRQPPGQPAGLSGPDRRRRRGSDPVRASRGSSQRSHHLPGRDDLRLAALSGRHPAQARRPAQRCAVRRTARGLQAAAGSICSSRPAATARWSRSWRWSCSTTSRPCWLPSSWRWRPASPTKTHVLNLLHRLVDGKADHGTGRSTRRRR